MLLREVLLGRTNAFGRIDAWTNRCLGELMLGRIHGFVRINAQALTLGRINAFGRIARDVFGRIHALRMCGESLANYLRIL